jgi:hypothetical protein
MDLDHAVDHDLWLPAGGRKQMRRFESYGLRWP